MGDRGWKERLICRSYNRYGQVGGKRKTDLSDAGTGCISK